MSDLNPEEIRRFYLTPSSLTDTSTALLRHYEEGTTFVDRDKSIIAQNAGTTAANLISTLVENGVSPERFDDFIEKFESIRIKVFNGTLSLAGAQSVVESFEGDPSSTENAFGGYGSAQPNPPSANGGGSSDAGSVDIRFGKHRGKTIAQVYAEDDSYVEWLAESANNDFIKSKAREFLATV